MRSGTEVIRVDPDNPDDSVLDIAADVIRNGGLVAFATETVYGLGADATKAEAVARIFEAKGRPAENPMIVHVSDREMARRCVADWPEQAEALAKRYWPGPLTLVLPRSSIIPDIVAGGLPTVGVRVPHGMVALALIVRAGCPIAAPSANRSTGVSPTLAAHVLDDLDGRVDLILDSGPTTVGLESTVVDLTTRQPHILRPGPYTAGELGHVLGGVHVREAPRSHQSDARPTSPGQMAVHYAPRTPAVRVETPEDLSWIAWPERAALIVVGPHEDMPPLPEGVEPFNLPLPGIAARDLYATLRQCDKLGVELIVVLPPPEQQEWHAIRDRIGRATRPWSD